MGKLNLAEEFISQINQQAIFRTYVETKLTTEKLELVSQSKLACRNNTDLFYTSENVVRCCTINPGTIKFKLLYNKLDKLKIRSLEMNSLGTLLALVGDENINVVTLPTSISASSTSLLPVRQYSVANIGGMVKKVIWQTVMVNDCGLVVLNNKSEIKSYDLSISSEIPQLIVNLNTYEEFRGEFATSIAFGSDNNLSGALTLYISTLSSKIYAIYPFISRISNIVTNSSSVMNLYRESILLLEKFEQEFSSNWSFDSVCQNPLKHSFIRQHQYVSHLYKQVQSEILPRKEIRNVLSGTPSELLVLEQELPDSFQSSLQGPLAQADNTPFDDIIQIKSNEYVSILATVSSSDLKNVRIRYYSQFKPLIMKWKQDGDMEKQSSNLPSQIFPHIRAKTKTESVYIKPKKGFGFIDVSNELLSNEGKKSTEQEERESKTECRNYSKEIYLHKEFYKLSLLATDEIPIKTHDNKVMMRNFGSDISYFALQINDDLIICDPTEWVNNICSRISFGETSSSFKIATKYKSPIKGSNKIHGFALIKDSVTESGEFIIVVDNNKVDNLKVIQISKKEQKKTIYDIPNNVNKNNIIPYESILIQEPFEELLNELQLLKKFSPYSLKSLIDGQILYQKIDESNVNCLKNINILSAKVIEEVSNFTKFAIHLKLRVLTQFDELKFQIESLNKVKHLNLDKKKLDENDEKIKTLTAKQDNINARIKILQEKVVAAVQKIQYKKGLPLSNAEKAWFREINSINIQCNQSTERNPSLNEIIKNLESQVKVLVKQAKGSASQVESVKEQSMEKKLKELRLYKDLNKIKSWLDEEDRLINITKIKLEDLFKKLQL